MFLLYPFLFIKNKSYFYPQRVSLPLKKKRCDMVSEGNASHPGKCDSPLQIVIWKKVCRMAIIICRGLSHPTRSFSRIVCKGPKGSKDTLRPDYLANTRPRILFFFLKSKCCSKDAGKTVARKSRYC
jgi:hypothetical protein